MNSLASATSPYLLQHANNPVHWQQWGPDALERAKIEDKPLLISIGYAACHWCHVMERESFENEAIAHVMNERFVCIKVDREERPDIDNVYMTATQAMTGHGGWPMTVFATPEGKPFFTGTYFPPEDRQGMPSFVRVMDAVWDAWTNRREELNEQSQKITEHIANLAHAAPGDPDEESLERAAQAMIAQHDPEWGGFGNGMKFPNTPALEFLLRMQVRPPRFDAAFGAAPGEESAGLREQARAALHRTLVRMARGGIFDHVAGGFHRYTVDRIWLVPHFEKMLYDNAQLLRLYARAWQVERADLYRETAIRTGEWMLDEMRHDGGAFFSSLDADSEGVEGKFYVWPFEELIAVTGDDMPMAVAIFAASGDGNWEGTNVLWRPHTDEEIAEQTGSTPSDVNAAFERIRARLASARAQRTRPATDDKILAGWNGLAIAALAEAGRALQLPHFVQAASNAARFIDEHVRTPSGGLARAWRDGRTSGEAFLDDYAMMADAFLTLYETTFEVEWFDKANAMANEMIDRFADHHDGGFFDTPASHGLVFRPKDVFDNATPSGNAVASDVLLRLAALEGDKDLERWGSGFLSSVGSAVAEQPLGFGAALCAIDRHLAGATEIAITPGVPGAAQDERIEALIAVAQGVYLPNRVLAVGTKGPRLLEGRTPLNGGPAAYVCRNFACDAPVGNPGELATKLDAS